MRTNPAIQNVGTSLWNGTASRVVDIRNFVNIGFSFEVTTTLTADAVFTVLAHDPLVTDNCLPGPGVAALAVGVCSTPAIGSLSTFTIPKGTLAGSICAGTIPCSFGAFISFSAVGGANVLVVAVRSGPML